MKHLWHQQMDDKELKTQMYLCMDWDKREENLKLKLSNIRHVIYWDSVGDDSFDTYTKSHMYFDNTLESINESMIDSWLEGIIWNPKTRKINYGIFHVQSNKLIEKIPLRNGLEEDL